MSNKVLFSKEFPNIPFSHSLLPQNKEIIDTEIANDEGITTYIKNFMAEGVLGVDQRKAQDGSTIASLVVLTSEQLSNIAKIHDFKEGNLSGDNMYGSPDIIQLKGDYPDIIKKLKKLLMEGLNQEDNQKDNPDQEDNPF